MEYLSERAVKVVYACDDEDGGAVGSNVASRLSRRPGSEATRAS